jgi:hypothetical protein
MPGASQVPVTSEDCDERGLRSLLSVRSPLESRSNETVVIDLAIRRLRSQPP